MICEKKRWWIIPVFHIFSRVVANTLDCDFVAHEFKLQSRYFVHFRINTFRKGINSLNPRTIGHYSSPYLQVVQFLYQSFSECTERTNYNWYHSHFHVPSFFQFPSKILVLIFLFTFFQFCSMICQGSKVDNSSGSLFCWLSVGLIVRWSICVSKSQRSLRVSFTRTDSELCIYHLFEWSNFNFLHNSQ